MKVKDWHKFQHFKDRSPPWIKLYRDILDDPDWHSLPPDSAKLLVMLWLVASEDATHEGKLPELRKLAFKLRTTEQALMRDVIPLSHWLELDDIETISGRYHDDAPEERRGETERETELRPVSTQAADAACVESLDETSVLWRDGTKLLAQLDLPERSAKSNIGRWLKSRTAGQILGAIRSAHRAGTKDPIPYVNQTLAANGSERMVEYLG